MGLKTITPTGEKILGGFDAKPHSGGACGFHQNHGRQVFWFRASKPEQGFDYGMWRHRRRSEEAKEAIRCPATVGSSF